VSCGLFNSVLWCSAVFRHTETFRHLHDSVPVSWAQITAGLSLQ